MCLFHYRWFDIFEQLWQNAWVISGFYGLQVFYIFSSDGMRKDGQEHSSYDFNKSDNFLWCFVFIYKYEYSQLISFPIFSALVTFMHFAWSFSMFSKFMSDFNKFFLFTYPHFRKLIWSTIDEAFANPAPPYQAVDYKEQVRFYHAHHSWSFCQPCSTIPRGRLLGTGKILSCPR